MNGLILIGAGLLAAVLIFITNWLALIPWRRSRDQHWSEQARVLWPARRAAATNFLFVLGINILLVLWLWPDSSPLWLFAGIVSVFGACAGTFPMDHEIFPRLSYRKLFQLATTSIFFRFLIWFVFFGAMVAMPDEFNQGAWAIGGIVVVLTICWLRGGLIQLAFKLGAFLPATERLQRITDDTSTRMNIPFRKVLLMRSGLAQAYALPGRGWLLFSERLLEILPDEEVAAICAHELAHLSESKTVKHFRFLKTFTFLPWIFIKPLFHEFGPLTFLGLLFLSLGASRIFGKISRKLEQRADQIAQTAEGDSGTYARALTHLYEDGLLPAVSLKKGTTHPHLYDRILAAGVTPDFPRPAPPEELAWPTRVFMVVMVILFVLFAVHSKLFSNGHGPASSTPF
ncbi:MAG TPA: M48 family metalloprotease [Verrucomicrobiae bacterium]